MAFLKSKGALVKVVHFPGGDKKIGLDDYLVAGHSMNEVLALATDSIASASAAPLFDDRGVEAYFEDEGAIYLKHCPTENGSANRDQTDQLRSAYRRRRPHR